MTILKIFPYENQTYKVLCKCDCGKEKIFYLNNIIPRKNGRYTVSCGCKRGELVSIKRSTHKLSKTRFYRIWGSMFDRLSDKYINSNAYKHVTIIPRWNKFENFRDDMYESYLKHVEQYGEKNTSIDRIDVHKGYSIENCRWATIQEQAFNKKNTHYVIYNNKKIPLKLLCKELNKEYGTVYFRLKYGKKTLEQALNNIPWQRNEK